MEDKNSKTEADKCGEKYGGNYFLVQLPKSTQYIFADAITIEHGCLVMHRMGTTPNAIFAPGQWRACYAADVVDGHPIAVEPSKPKKTLKQKKANKKAWIVPVSAARKSVKKKTG